MSNYQFLKIEFFYASSLHKSWQLFFETHINLNKKYIIKLFWRTLKSLICFPSIKEQIEKLRMGGEEIQNHLSNFD